MNTIEDVRKQQRKETAMPDKKVYGRIGLLIRCEPKSVAQENPSPSGDPYFLNPANIAAIERGAQQAREGKVRWVTPELKKEMYAGL